MCAYIAPSSEAMKALETVPSLLLIISPTLEILTASDLYLEATQTLRERIVGKFIFEAFPANPNFPEGDGVKNINASLQEVLHSKQAHYMQDQRYDVPDIHNPGKFLRRYWNASHTPVFDDNGEISYIIQLSNNISDKVLVEKQLSDSRTQQAESVLKVTNLNHKLDIAHQELVDLNISLERQVNDRTLELEKSEEKYRNLIQYSPVAMQVFRGDDLTFEIVNESMLKFLGKTAEIIGKPLFEGVPEIVGQPIVDVLYGVYRTGIPLELFGEEVSLIRDGKIETGFYDVIYRPLYDVDVITGVLGIAIDVTPQVKAKIAIEESEVRFRTMAEGSGILISTIDINGKVDYLNKTWMEFTGQPVEALQVSSWDNFIHPDDLYELNRIYKEGMSTRKSFVCEFRILDANQRYRWIRLKGAPRFDANKSFQGYICSGVDFTEERQQLLEIAHINVALVRANEQLESTNEKLSHSEENLQSAFNAADLGSCSLDLKTGKAEMSLRYRSLYGLPLDGEITWEMVLEAVDPEFLEEVNRAMINAMNYGMPVDSTYAIRHLETGERRWMRVAGKVRINEEGMFSHVYAVVMDVTVQKQDEQRKNDFIAMVSHELKTPLTSVTGYAQVLKRLAYKTEDLKTSTLLDKMELQVKKMSSMINGFLNISRLESGKIQMEVQQFDINLLITEIVDEFTATTSGHLIEYYTPQPNMVNADRDKVGHVINNLISNAIKYSGSSSQVNISCTIKGDIMVFSIKDQGIGVNSQDLPKLFDRYYRVQGSQSSSVSGFGIGLYLSAEIIERHGGKIWAESEPGLGSTFYFSLPISDTSTLI